MISITNYWEQFEDCIKYLPKSEETKIARSLIIIGKGIEKLGLTEIKQVTNTLYEKAKQFKHFVTYPTPEQKHTFYLPKITNTRSLIFAIVYYQHLNNYQNAVYKGSIIWPANKIVEKGVNEKKITTNFQSLAMLDEIKQYCKNRNLELNEAQLLRLNDEKAEDYIARITKAFTPPPIEIPQPVQPEEQLIVIEEQKPDEQPRLEAAIEELKIKKSKQQSKIDTFTNKLIQFNQASQNYLLLDKEWQALPFLKKIYYWIHSIFSPVPLLHNLKLAEVNLEGAEENLKQEYSPHETAEICRLELNNQLDILNREYESVTGQLIQVKLEKEKQQELVNLKQEQQQQQLLLKQQIQQLQQQAEASQIVESESEELDETEMKSSTINESNEGREEANYCSQLYSFFSENLPRRQYLQAALVAGVAIAVQNMQ